MTEAQLYVAIGVPTIAILIGILLNGLLYNALSARMSGVEARMLSLENTLTARFDLMIGKLAGIARLSVESSGSRVTHFTTPSCVLQSPVWMESRLPVL